MAQEIKKLTFDEVIKLSEEQSPNALIAKHRFRASYWQYRTFVAQYRPSLTLSGSTPDYSTAYDKGLELQHQPVGISGHQYSPEPGITFAFSEYWIYRRNNLA